MTIKGMIAAGDVAGLQALAHEPDKETRKAARKGLHILRTRGMVAPVPLPGEKPVARREEYSFPGMVSPEEADSAMAAALLLPGMLRRRRRRPVEP